MNSESVDLIYLDPPFNSKRFYSAPVGSKSAGASFKDMWTWQDVDEACLERLVSNYPYLVQFIEAVEGIHGKPMMSYITYMTQRVIELHRVLKSTGSLYLHCDPTASHYLKVLLDRVFGKGNFLNEIIWHYYNGSNRAKTNFGRKHDVIFFYAKKRDKHLYNWNDMREPYVKGSSYAKGTNYGKKGFLQGDERGKLMHDVWRIPSINNMAKERTGYPTQKPLALLNRIIKASSKKGDVVFDPFCGCATTMVAAQQLQRGWVGIDIESKAAELVVDRLSDEAGLFDEFIHRKDVPVRTDVKIESEKSKSVKDRLFNEQKGACNGCRDEFEIRHFEVDHIIPRSKGGGNYYENYQLLCGSCNRTKGNRPMEYLHKKITAREKHMQHRITFGA